MIKISLALLRGLGIFRVMTEPNPSLEDVRARRRQLAEEDRELAFIEAGLIKLANQWQALWQHAEEQVKPKLPIITPYPIVTPISSDVPLPTRAKTKNALIIEALNHPRERWQTAKQIRDYIAKVTEKDVPMSSISPALTDLKKSGTIARNDMLVALALRLEKEEPGFLNENGEAKASPETGEPPSSPN